MKLKLPAVIRIGNHPYRVKASKGPIDGRSEGNLLGRSTYRDSLIEVDVTTSASQVRDTLLHEVLHSVLYEAPHGLNHAKEERVVQALTGTLLGVLRSNPEFLEFLLKD